MSFLSYALHITSATKQRTLTKQRAVESQEVWVHDIDLWP